MSDRERVLDAFRNCITEPKCKDCPWTECSTLDNGCVEIPRDLALAVMRELVAQEPRLITEADFADNPMIDDDGNLPVWVEFNHEKYGEFFEEDADGWGCANINKIGNDMARYWTSKPSLKQMEETPWP